MTMTTKEAVQEVRSQCGLAHTALVMAFATIAERIRILPRADQNDLYALMKELPGANEEEMESIMTAALEILEQAPVHVMPMNPEADSMPGDRPQKWLNWVSEKIRDERKKAGLTQEQLAEKSCLPQSHISRLEHAQHSPSRGTLEKIAAALGIEVGVFDPSA